MYYSVSMGNGNGVFFMDTSSKDSVKHEIENLPAGWHINIWLMQDNDTPIKKCEVSEF